MVLFIACVYKIIYLQLKRFGFKGFKIHFGVGNASLSRSHYLINPGFFTVEQFSLQLVRRSNPFYDILALHSFSPKKKLSSFHYE